MLQSVCLCVRLQQRQIGSVMPVVSSGLVFTPTTFSNMESAQTEFESEMTQSSDYLSDESSDSWQQQTLGQIAGMPAQTNTARRLPGPKSSVRTEDMTAEEIRRRDRRRQRNKLAAARCRQRRLDITNQLLAVCIIHCTFQSRCSCHCCAFYAQIFFLIHLPFC